MTQEKKNYMLPILMMMMLFAMISFVTGLASPIGVILKDEFGASDTMSQFGNLANFIAYAFMGVPAGLLLQRVGYKKTALLAIIVGFVGVGIQYLSGVASSFAVYVAGAFVAGFSMCLLNSVVNPMLNTLGGGGTKGNQLLQLGGSLNSLAATITPALVGFLIGNSMKATIKDANPALFIAMGIFAIVFVVLALVKIPEPNMEVVKKDKKDKHSALSFRHFILGAVGVFVYVGVEVGIPAFMFLYLTKTAGMGADIAGSVVAIYWLLMLVGRLTGASLGSKISSKTMLTVASVLGLVFVTIAIVSPAETMTSMPAFIKETLSFGMVEVPISILFLSLCGLCTSIMWGGIYNLAVEGLGKYVKMATGIFMVMVCGGGILPVIQGAVADSTESYLASYWVVFAGLAYLLYYALIGSKNVNKDIPVD